MKIEKLPFVKITELCGDDIPNNQIYCQEMYLQFYKGSRDDYIEEAIIMLRDLEWKEVHSTIFVHEMRYDHTPKEVLSIDIKGVRYHLQFAHDSKSSVFVYFKKSS